MFKKTWARPALLKIACAVSMVVLTGCGKKTDSQPEDNPLDITTCHRIVSEINQLHEQTDERFGRLLESGKRDEIGSILDPQDYFSIFTHLSVPERCVLDSVYDAMNSNARPVLYIRKEQDCPFQSEAEYTRATGLKELYDQKQYDQAEIKRTEYYRLVKADGSAEGFFELAVYSTLAGQYCLMWHANYFDTEVIIVKDDIERVLSETKIGTPFNRALKKAARRIDPTPTVSSNENSVDVSLVLFSKWGGFHRQTFTYQKAYPHEFKTDDETLVEYNCGIVF